eukprot:SAG11_NODE_4660_length_1817_cov_4.173458_2_plen_105_part_00
MESLSELKRSSATKKVRADARRAAFEKQIRTKHGDVVYETLLRSHDQAVRNQYGVALTNGWLPNEISVLFCIDDVKVTLGDTFNINFYLIAWETLFGAVTRDDE